MLPSLANSTTTSVGKRRTDHCFNKQLLLLGERGYERSIIRCILLKWRPVIIARFPVWKPLRMQRFSVYDGLHSPRENSVCGIQAQTLPFSRHRNFWNRCMLLSLHFSFFKWWPCRNVNATSRICPAVSRSGWQSLSSALWSHLVWWLLKEILFDCRFGRKRPYFIAIVLVVAAAIGASFSPNYIVYCLLEFVMGINTVALFATAVTLGEHLLNNFLPPWSSGNIVAMVFDMTYEFYRLTLWLAKAKLRMLNVCATRIQLVMW